VIVRSMMQRGKAIAIPAPHRKGRLNDAPLPMSWRPLLFLSGFLIPLRQSGILYFRVLSLAWAVAGGGGCSRRPYFSTGKLFWLGPYALFEFAFALALLVAAAFRAVARHIHVEIRATPFCSGFPCSSSSCIAGPAE